MTMRKAPRSQREMSWTNAEAASEFMKRIANPNRHDRERRSGSWTAPRRIEDNAPLVALNCRAGGADQCPKLGVERTQRGHAVMAESDPLRKSGGQNCCDAQHVSLSTMW